jgi:hypothetical protein
MTLTSTPRRGIGANASKFILFLEGGGWCFGVEDCTGRRGGGLGSSKGYAPGVPPATSAG